MSPRRQRKTHSLMTQAAELAFAAPQVVAHRVTRMAIAGPAPSQRDRTEFHRMGTEKASAFSESWNAMARQAMLAQRTLTTSWVHSFWSSAFGNPPAQAMPAQLHDAALDVLSKGMEPVHRRAVANARRLSRTKLR